MEHDFARLVRRRRASNRFAGHVELNPDLHGERWILAGRVLEGTRHRDGFQPTARAPRRPREWPELLVDLLRRGTAAVAARRSMAGSVTATPHC